MSNYKIGYSFWGFLGDGVVDTPDGGRSHRIVLINELIRRKCKLFMLQKNRDLEEAGEDYSNNLIIFDEGFPDIEVLFLEYRWKIPGRNCGISKDSLGYCPDLDRQEELIRHYSLKRIPILIWDKDQQLTHEDETNIVTSNYFIFEPSLLPSKGRGMLLFPVDISKIQSAQYNLHYYSKMTKDIKLIYIGNQYDRDESFEKYYDLVGKMLKTEIQVYGKWTKIDKFYYSKFHGRVAYSQTASLYKRSLACIAIAPKRYYLSGQFTQRIFESTWSHCLTLVPSEYAAKEHIFPDFLVVESAEEVVRKIKEIEEMSDLEVSKILNEFINTLKKTFSVEKQVDAILAKIEEMI